MFFFVFCTNTHQGRLLRPLGLLFPLSFLHVDEHFFQSTRCCRRGGEPEPQTNKKVDVKHPVQSRSSRQSSAMSALSEAKMFHYVNHFSFLSSQSNLNQTRLFLVVIRHLSPVDIPLVPVEKSIIQPLKFLFNTLSFLSTILLHLKFYWDLSIAFLRQSSHQKVISMCVFLLLVLSLCVILATR